MARAKNGTRMSHISVMNEEISTTWVDNHYIGILRTLGDPDDMLTEAELTIETEDSLTLENNGTESDIEITTISFVGDESATPNATVGEFKVL